MTGTPRTDALLRERGECRDSAFLNFARDLEREIAAARAALEDVATRGVAFNSVGVDLLRCIAREALAAIK